MSDDVTEAPEAAEGGGRRGGGRRGGGRAGRQAARSAAAATKPYLERTMAPVEMITEEGLAAIEENAEEILATVGVAFQEFPEALDLWRQAGAKVEGEMVYFPKGMCREIVQNSAPKSYIQHARNPERSVKIGEN
ncbi:MAG: trimethylamine methyltransferase family protein, partial [Actinomycetota bacterium]